MHAKPRKRYGLLITLVIAFLGVMIWPSAHPALSSTADHPAHLTSHFTRPAKTPGASLSGLSAISARRLPAALTRQGAFRELRHPRYSLVRMPRINARIAAAAAAANAPLTLGSGVAAHFSATGFEGCVMHAESNGVSTAWYPGHTDGSLPVPNSPVAEGLFGFLLSTWRGLGLGWPQGASFAPAKVQIQGFWKLYDAQGTAPWNGDGCAGGSAAAYSARPMSIQSNQVASPEFTQASQMSYHSASISLMSLTNAAPLLRVRHHHRHCRNHARWLAKIRAKAMAFAVSQRGKPYEWGETGPYGYDCSGLVYASYHHAGGPGRRLGRATYDMLGQVGVLLRQVWHPVRGDLAFFGSGHVELYAGHFDGHSWTFGALDPGTNVGRHLISQWWQPTMYFEVV